MSGDEAMPGGTREPAADRGPVGPGPRATWRPWGRRLAIAAGVAGAVLLPLLLRAGLEARAELAEADRAHDRGDLDAEIVHLGRALRWRVPLSGTDEDAIDRLEALARAQEALGPQGRDAALAAHRELRRGLLATRVLDVPHRERWAHANARIAALMAEQEREQGTDASGTGDPEAYHLALLSREPGPAPLRGHLAALGFSGWVIAVVGFLLRAIGPRGRLRPRPALRWGLGVVGLLVAWAVLLAGAHG